VYEDFLVENGFLPPISGHVEQARMAKRERKEKQAVQRDEDREIAVLIAAMLSVGKEMLVLLKIVCVLLVLVLVFQIISVVH
jgi:hypothetical protein